MTEQSFNPRPREEGDRLRLKAKGFTSRFNPRPREEGDKSALTDLLVLPSFNPRPREEGDLRLAHSVSKQHRFQSTPS